MERIAIISDIHGNITALEAALEDIRRRKIKKIFCLGDMIIKCSSPSECVKKIFENCEVIVKGNCEERAIEDPIIDEHYWNRDMLTQEQREKIINLPLYYDFYMSGLKVRLMHASPTSVHQRGYFWNYDDDFEQKVKIMFKNTEYFGNLEDKEKVNVAIFGHIHRSMVLRIDKNKSLINPGGISNTSDIVKINGKNYAYGSYLILEGEYESREVSPISYTIVKFPYDNMKEAENILKTDMPNKDKAYEEIATGKYFNRKRLNEMAAAMKKNRNKR